MAAFADDAMERERDQSSPSSRSSSGCQSGWTLYLDHSYNGARYVVPAYGDPTAAQRWMLLQQAEHADRDDDEEDSMASDASSGPRPRPRQEDDDARRRDFVFQRGSYSSTSGLRSGASGSGSFGSSTWSRSSSQGGIARTTAAVIFRGEATSTRQYHREVILNVIDDDGDDELDDTASSSAVFSNPMPMLHAR